MATLKDYGTFISGVPLPKITLDENNAAESENAIDRCQYIRPQDLARSVLLDEEHLSQLDYIKLNAEFFSRLNPDVFVQPNDILICARGTNYHVAMIKQIDPDRRIIMSNNTICFRPKIDHAEVIVMYLNSDWFKQHVIAKEFPKMLTLSIKWLKNLSFDCPNEAQRIRLGALLNHYQALEQATLRLQHTQKQRLDAELFAHVQPHEEH